MEIYKIYILLLLIGYTFGDAQIAYALSEQDLHIEFDYRPILGPVRDQDQTNLCFAHAVADAMTLLHNGRRVGAASVAFRYFSKRSGFEFFVVEPLSTVAGTYQAGFARTALTSATSSILCDSSEEQDQYSDTMLRDVKTAHNAWRSVISPVEPVAITQNFLDKSQDMFPGLPISSLKEQLNPFKTLEETYGLWFDRECHISPLNKNFSLVGRSLFQNAKTALANVDEALANQAIAVIHYNPEPLWGSNPPTIFQTMTIGMHVSTIVGKARDHKNQIYYLLRNTWGPNCSGYSDKFIERCELGHIWLNNKELAEMITSSVYIQKNN